MSDNPNKPHPKEMLQLLIERTKLLAYTNPADADDTEALGVLVSQWTEWDGAKIVEVFASALEDANYHTFRAKMLTLWELEEATTAEVRTQIARQAAEGSDPVQP